MSEALSLLLLCLNGMDKDNFNFLTVLQGQFADVDCAAIRLL